MSRLFNLFSCFCDPNSLQLENNSLQLENNSLKLENTILKYKVINNKYIITYISSYDKNLNDYLNSIFNEINKFYKQKNLQYLRCCGNNAEYICNNLKIKGINVGKIIIQDWKNNMKEVDLETIRTTYDNHYICIGSSYHALSYLTLKIKEITYHIAIETTSNYPYKLQFYIGNSYKELSTILHLCTIKTPN